MKVLYKSAATLFLTAFSVVAATGLVDLRSQRIAAVGKLWFTVKYFHPYLNYRQIDWDQAFVEAYPAIVQAKTQEQRADAVDRMLGVLGDSVTRVKRPSLPTFTPKADGPLFRVRNKGGVLLIQFSNLSTAKDSKLVLQQGGELADRIDTAGAIVFDFRMPDPDLDLADLLEGLFSETDLSAHLFRGVLSMPGSVQSFHRGLAAASGDLGDPYYSGVMVHSATDLKAANSSKDHTVVFLADANTVLPSIALALQHAGKALIFAETPTVRSTNVKTVPVPLEDDLIALVRTSQAVFSDGTGELPPTQVLAHDEILPRALEEASHPSHDRTHRTAALSLVPREQHDRSYADMPLPAVPYRLLAGFQIWGVFQHFFAYRHLMNEDWSAVLTQFIPRLEAAQTARDYHLTVAEMVTHVHDTHAFVRGPEHKKLWGATTLVQVRAIEGKPVVTKICDSSAARSGVQVGDVILTVDGEEAGARRSRLGRYIASSTPQALQRDEASRLLDGPDQSTAILVVEREGGQRAEVNLERSVKFWKQKRHYRNGDVVQILPNGIGYVDLDRLGSDEVNSMFEKVKNTVATIFDMRGYPNGDTGWQIAPRLTDQQRPEAADAYFPISLEPDLKGTGETGTFKHSRWTLPAPEGFQYKGRTMMLIDERTQSSAEHTGLFFEAANGTKFIGSPTTGANGDITNFVVPGDITIYFSGIDVRHFDGRQLQRIGLIPDVSVEPTITGIRAGRDEVLERAVAFISQ